MSSARTTAEDRKALSPQLRLHSRRTCNLMADHLSLCGAENCVPVGADQKVEPGALHLELAAARGDQKAAALLQVLAGQAGADQSAKGPPPAEDRKRHRLGPLLDVRLALEQHRPQRRFSFIIPSNAQH